MTVIVLLSGLAQATFSQASTHILNVEGIRLKTALQGLIYDKILKLSNNTILSSYCSSTNKVKNSKEQDQDEIFKSCDKNKTSQIDTVNSEEEINVFSDDDISRNSATNLLADDVYNIMSCYWIGHYIWAIPLKIIILMYLLYWKLGISAVIGATTCILFVLPLQFIIGKKMSSNTKGVSEYSDKRLWQINEVLQGIRLLKLCGWEFDYYKKLSDTRSKELQLLDNDSLYWAIMTFLTHISSVFVSLVTFVIYYIFEGGQPSPESVFSGLALFNQLTVPLFIFPITVPIIISAQVSTRRLAKFLKLPEITAVINDDDFDRTFNKKRKKYFISNVEGGEGVTKHGAINRLPSENKFNCRKLSLFGLMNITEQEENDSAFVETDSFGDGRKCLVDKTAGINVNCCDNKKNQGTLCNNEDDVVLIVMDAQFTWVMDSNHNGVDCGERKVQTCKVNKCSLLYVKNLRIQKGKLNMIIGKIGSGKSSLLNALLGEMRCVAGSIVWSRNCRVAYVPQKSWLINGSVRDNILFGSPFKESRYNRVLSACALLQDIELLPYKDMTEVVEQGINLSGGQRQRITIARALYSTADVILLDDPLSALDNFVAEHVFLDGIKTACINHNRTIIMVTHLYRLLPHAHQVIVMDNNKVGGCGDVSELAKRQTYDNCSIDSGLIDEFYNAMIQNYNKYSYNDVPLKETKQKDNVINVSNDGVNNINDENIQRTAKERWLLIKLILSLGFQSNRCHDTNKGAATGTADKNHEEPKMVHHNLKRSSSYKQQESPVFIPFRKRLGTFSGSRYLAHDLLLPTDECEEDDELMRRRPDRSGNLSLKRHKTILRATSLQTETQRFSHYLPTVTRQSSSPNINPVSYSYTRKSTLNDAKASTFVSSEKIPRYGKWRNHTVSGGSPSVFSSSCVSKSNRNGSITRKAVNSKSMPLKDTNYSVMKSLGTNNGRNKYIDLDLVRTETERCSFLSQGNTVLPSGRNTLLRQLFNKSLERCNSRGEENCLTKLSSGNNNASPVQNYSLRYTKRTASTPAYMLRSDAVSESASISCNSNTSENIKRQKNSDREDCNRKVFDSSDDGNVAVAADNNKIEFSNNDDDDDYVNSRVEDDDDNNEEEDKLDCDLTEFVESLAVEQSDVNNEQHYYCSSNDSYIATAASPSSSGSEEREYGKISHAIYLAYMRCCGLFLSIIYVSSTVLWQLLRIATDFWLSKWSSSSQKFHSPYVTDQKNQVGFYYLVIYAGLSASTVVLSLVSNCLGQYCASRARRVLHDDMLLSLMKCPIKFFENTPLGRIINRFSTDIAVIDKKIGTSIQRLLQFVLLCASAVIVNAVVTPWFLTIAIPITIIYYTIQKFYRCSSRELQRLESIARSPVMSHFMETLSGVEVIRAFSQQKRFIALFNEKLDAHTNAFLIFNSAHRWLGIVLDYLGAFIVFLAMFICLIMSSLFQDKITPASVGLAINYTLLMPIYLNWVVKFLSDTEIYMGAVERVNQYTIAESEDYGNDRVVPYCWPTSGDIKFNNVTLCYYTASSNKHSEQIIVVKNLTLHIPHGQKIGICGRTGSGKSSLAMSLFNMVPIYEGQILIDDHHIIDLPLQLLRSKLSIIPQDVIMFSGTIRDNLDVRNKYSDSDLWKCLESAGLKEIVINDLGGLDGRVKEGGGNLSAGQKQLFCLARAILHNAVCLVMDEATSSLDVETERKLLKAADSAFQGRTVIIIAHRLENLLQCDRVIVLDCGKIVEDGSPSYLLTRSMGIFSNMMKNAKAADPLIKSKIAADTSGNEI